MKRNLMGDEIAYQIHDECFIFNLINIVRAVLALVVFSSTFNNKKKILKNVQAIY